MTIFGVPYQNPLDYTGPGQNVVPIKSFPRIPLTTDVKYRPGQLALLSKDPSTGTQGELYYLANFNSSGQAIWLKFSTGDDEVESFIPDSGTSPVVPNSSNQVTMTGSGGISVVGGTNTLTFTGSGAGFDWNNVTGTTQSLAASNAYIANNAGLVTFSLPATAALGDVYMIVGYGAGGWTVSQNAGQSIILGALTSTTGVGGSISSILASNCVTIACIVADTAFKVINSMGNITVV